MYRSLAQAVLWSQEHRNKLEQLSVENNCSIIICPSNQSLYALQNIFEGTSITLGAQDCSEFDCGPHTGQSSALSLAQAGAKYCIVGHTEVRTYYHQSNDIIAHKLTQVIQDGLTPIICIGETIEQHTDKQSQAVITEQLTPLIQIAAAKNAQKLFIAYEPVWAIGTGSIPSPEYIQTMIAHIDQLCKKYLTTTKYNLLYGGSVTPQTISQLKAITIIDGFLIGSASLDFQKLQNIVSCTV